MTIDVVDEADPREWKTLTESDEASTFFHTIEWGKLIEDTLPGWRRFYIVARSDGAAVGGLPGMRRLVGGITRVVSMPFGTFGGPVLGPSAPSEAPSGLVDAFFDMARPIGVAAAHLIDVSMRIGKAPRGARRTMDEMQVLALGDSCDDLWNAYKPSNRNKIRKAQKAGVTVRRAEGKRDFLEYHGTLADCHKRWGTSVPLGQSFFEVLSTLDRGAVRMWIAEYEGAVVGGLLNFGHQKQIINWGNVSLSSVWKLSPNNILHATAIEQAIRDGYREYNFGSSAGLSGVDAFKAAFGTTRVQFASYSVEKLWYRWARALTRRRAATQQARVERGT